MFEVHKFSVSFSFPKLLPVLIEYTVELLGRIRSRHLCRCNNHHITMHAAHENANQHLKVGWTKQRLLWQCLTARFLAKERLDYCAFDQVYDQHGITDQVSRICNKRVLAFRKINLLVSVCALGALITVGLDCLQITLNSLIVLFVVYSLPSCICLFCFLLRIQQM